MRKLNKSEIDFRVGMIKKTAEKVWCTLLAYKDARVDMAMLDHEFGQMNWQTEYKRDSKGVLQCGIGVFDSENKHWVWKWSNGTESQTEAQKGEYSDAFKRAGFMWGIGRELYDVPTLFVTLNSDEYSMQGDKVKQSSRFQPNKWDWEITDKHIKATQNGVQRVFAKYDEVVDVPNSKPSTPQKIVVKNGSKEFMAIVDWIINGKGNAKGEIVHGTIEKAKQAYSISEAVENSLKEKIQSLKEIA